MEFLGVKGMFVCAKVSSQLFETRFLSIGTGLCLHRLFRATTAT